jgi:hypothetical protein
MTIDRIETKELADVIAALVQKGLTFRCFPARGYDSGVWTIELTGGY